jgi:hypothetical protein
LNPIFDYAAKGQAHEKNDSWEEAVHWYHRSLACLPNLYGADRPIQQLSFVKSAPISFSPKHAGRIYSALGRCLNALGRTDDSVLAYRAAHCLDPDSTEAHRNMHTCSHILEKNCAFDSVLLPPIKHASVDRKSNLTLIVVTHCTDRLKKFEALSPPSCKLITTTYASLLKVFGKELDNCPKILCYDFNSNGGDRESLYHQALEAFAGEYEFNLYTYPGVGLFNILNSIINNITTPYLFFVEHDWFFQGGTLQLGAIVGMMDSDPKIHSVRFNKRNNHLDGQDFIMNVHRSPHAYPLLSTSSYSNNPSIVRTQKLKKDWLPRCEKALERVSKELGGSAFGIEEILFKQLVGNIRASGFEKGHGKWGTYVFGRVGDPPRIVHLGE